MAEKEKNLKTSSASKTKTSSSVSAPKNNKTVAPSSVKSAKEKKDELKKKEEEKLKKEAMKAKTAERKTSSSNAQTNQDKRSSKKLSITSDDVSLKDLEAVNEENIKKYRSRSARNRFVIIVLVILLLLATIGVGIVVSSIYMENTCFLYSYGTNIQFIVDGKELTKFRAPSNVGGNTCYNVNLSAKVKVAGTYRIKYSIKVYQNNELLKNIRIYEPGENFTNGEDGFYYSKTALTFNSGDEVKFCKGIVIDSDYVYTLNINNFKMEMYVYFENA